MQSPCGTRRLFASALAVASLAACSDAIVPDPDAASPRPEASRGQSPPPSSWHPTLDDQFAELVAEVPGFGGLSYDADGSLVVYLRDPAGRGSARAPLASFLTRNGRDPRDADAMVVRRGDYDFRQLKGWYAALTAGLGSDGITQTDIDETANRIVIGVIDPAAAERVSRRLATLPVPEGAVVVKVVPPTEMMISLRERYRPVIGGLKIQTNAGECTLSFSAYRLGELFTVDQTHGYFVTNSHCTESFGAVSSVYGAAGQPDAANYIGSELVDPPLFTSTQNSDCPPGRKCRNSDAALFQYDPSVQFNWGGLARTSFFFSPLSISGVHQISSARGNTGTFVGAELKKVGQRTGTTTGALTGTCLRVVQYQNGVDSGRDLLCQYQADFRVDAGDSGSPVYSVTNNSETPGYHLKGILWGTAYSVYGDTGSPIRATFSDYQLAHEEIWKASGIWMVSCSTGYCQ